MLRSAALVAAVLVTPVASRAAPDFAPLHPHAYARPYLHRNFRYLLPLPQPAPIVPQPAPPPLHIHNHPYEGPGEGESVPYPEQLYPGGAPSLPGGMQITVIKDLTDQPQPQDKQPQDNQSQDSQKQDSQQQKGPITLPKQAAERLLACWDPPLPAKGSENEVSLRFSFNRSGSVIGGSPRITFVKAGQGVKPDDVRSSILSAFKSCTPLNFSASMASSMPGYPLSVRFIGRRPQDQSSRVR